MVSYPFLSILKSSLLFPFNISAISLASINISQISDNNLLYVVLSLSIMMIA